jgi:Zn-dependent peptidase ImmA (M78 family)/transcriptional regulator with XRE-family HTH domain
MARINVSARLLQWARERAGIDLEHLTERFPKLPEWEAGEVQPTLKQLEAFAKAVYAPIGYFFLDAPPHEELPIPDFRTFDNRQVVRPSPNLLDMVYVCQERQAWYKEFARIHRLAQSPYVGSLALSTSPIEAANKIRQDIGFNVDARQACRNWEEALRLFIQNVDQAGILIMISGVVMSNNKRTLNLQEFRGFALSDSLAPLIFINGADTKSGQMFTIAHELAHIWLDSSGISNASAARSRSGGRTEVWCNAVAAELLVPLTALISALMPDESLWDAVARLKRRFKVSSLVILRRLLDAGWITDEEFRAAWLFERERLAAVVSSSGGDFYNTTLSRVSRRFAKAVIGSTLEGQTLYRDAFRMLGVRKTETFNHLGRDVGVML